MIDNSSTTEFIKRVSSDYTKDNYSTEDDFEIDLNTISNKNKLIKISDEILNNLKCNKTKKKVKEKQVKLKDTNIENKNTLDNKDDIQIEENKDEKEKIDKKEEIIKTTKEKNSTKVKKLEKEKIDLNLVITNDKGNKVFNNLAYTNSTKSIKEQKSESKTYSWEFPYLERKLLTVAEHKLFKLLKDNIIYVNGLKSNRVSILTKVRLADLVDVDAKITEDKSYFYKISSKHIDFILYDEINNKVICGIELFDFTHNQSEETKKSDEFKKKLFRCINIPLVCITNPINTIVSGDLDFINDYVAEYFKKYMRCPDCGDTMCVKRSKAFKNFGHMFYSCNNYPLCKGNIDIN